MQKNKLNLHICGIHLLNPYKTVVSHLNLMSKLGPAKTTPTATKMKWKVGDNRQTCDDINNFSSQAFVFVYSMHYGNRFTDDTVLSDHSWIREFIKPRSVVVYIGYGDIDNGCGELGQGIAMILCSHHKIIALWIGFSIDFARNTDKT